MSTQTPCKGTKILVIGGHGFIGTYVARALYEAGAEVSTLSRSPRRCTDGIHRIACDINDSESLKRSLAAVKPATVVHLSSQPDGPESYQHARSCLTTNTLGTLALLDAIVEVGETNLLVYGDSTKSYGSCDDKYHAGLAHRPLSSYAISKVAGWEMCRLYHRIHGLSVVSIRPTLIYGPGQPRNLIDFVIQCERKGQGELKLQGGSQTRDPLFVDDAVSAYVAAVERGGELGESVVNIGGGREYSVENVARRIVELMGSRMKVSCDDSKLRPTDTLRSCCDNQGAQDLLGWSPRYDLDSGLRSTIDYYLELEEKAS